MKGKVLAVVVLAVVGLAVLVSGRGAQAFSHSDLAIDNVFEGINSGDVEMAVTEFAEGATYENLVRKESYTGLSEIRKVLDGMHRPGRRYDIVAVQTNGDTLTARVEVSDRGHVWGTEIIEAVVNQDGSLQSFTVESIRLELWRIGRK